MPTPDPDAGFLHTGRLPVLTGDDSESKELVDKIKVLNDDKASYDEMAYLSFLNRQQWSDAGFTNGDAIKRYVDNMYTQIWMTASSIPKCYVSPRCNSTEVKENLRTLYQEAVEQVPALYSAVKRVDDVLNGRTPQGPLTSESNIDANDVTDNRTYKIKAADNKELTPHNGVLLPAQTGIPNTLITVPQFTVNYYGTKNKPIISLEGVETVDSMTTDSHKAMVTNV
ncbi:hypothetical protein C8721_005291, partial [Salmonella enterica subsp. enterica serovar Berta]|nr:hypothetical protein [Salmonella enterica subsp. enterica serovar Berta]